MNINEQTPIRVTRLSAPRTVSRINRIALAQMKGNGAYLVTVHNGDIVKVSEVSRPTITRSWLDLLNTDLGDFAERMGIQSVVEVLIDDGFSSVGEVLQAADERLLEIKGFGPASLRKVRDAIYNFAKS